MPDVGPPDARQEGTMVRCRAATVVAWRVTDIAPLVANAINAVSAARGVRLRLRSIRMRVLTGSGVSVASAKGLGPMYSSGGFHGTPMNKLQELSRAWFVSRVLDLLTAANRYVVVYVWAPLKRASVPAWLHGLPQFCMVAAVGRPARVHFGNARARGTPRQYGTCKARVPNGHDLRYSGFPAVRRGSSSCNYWYAQSRAVC